MNQCGTKREGMSPHKQPSWLQKERDLSKYFHRQDPELKATLDQFVIKCRIYREPDIFEGTRKLFLGVLPASISKRKAVRLDLHYQGNISCLKALLLLQDCLEILLVLIVTESTNWRAWIVWLDTTIPSGNPPFGAPWSSGTLTRRSHITFPSLKHFVLRLTKMPATLSLTLARRISWVSNSLQGLAEGSFHFYGNIRNQRMSAPQLSWGCHRCIPGCHHHLLQWPCWAPWTGHRSPGIDLCNGGCGNQLVDTGWEHKSFSVQWDLLIVKVIHFPSCFGWLVLSYLKEGSYGRQSFGRLDRY